jgi:DNA-binding beta-propeller fold protein YncE
MTDLDVRPRPAVATATDTDGVPADLALDTGPEASAGVPVGVLVEPPEAPAIVAPTGDDGATVVAPVDAEDSSEIGVEPNLEVADEAAGGTPTTELAAHARRRRRRIALLAVLAIAATGLVLFSAWYLITRKPISELPLPGLTTEAVPTYSFSVYGITAPTGVAVTPDGGRLYVTQTEGEPRVLVFDGRGNPLGTLDPPATTGTDHVPVYIALDPGNGDVYVSDRPTGSIYVYGSDGTFLREFNPGKSLGGWQPLGVAFDSQRHLYVTDVSGPFNSIHEFDAEGALVRTIGKAGQFNFPNGIAIDAAGNLYITDSNNGRLVVLDPSGQERAVVRRGAGAGDLGLPRGTAIDDSGRVYVVDTTDHDVQVYHLIGTESVPPAYIGQFGMLGTDDGAFQYPNGVAVDDRARVYVTDWRNNRVQVWTY